MPHWGKATSENDAFYGFVSAILIMGALFVWLLTESAWFIPPALFVMGLILVLDTVFPHDDQVFVVSWLVGLLIGCLTVLFSYAYGYMYWFLAAASIVFVLDIAARIVRRISK